MKSNEYASMLVEDGVHHISDYRGDSFYLIFGDNKAILFDRYGEWRSERIYKESY